MHSKFSLFFVFLFLCINVMFTRMGDGKLSGGICSLESLMGAILMGITYGNIDGNKVHILESHLGQEGGEYSI